MINAHKCAWKYLKRATVGPHQQPANGSKHNTKSASAVSQLSDSVSNSQIYTVHTKPGHKHRKNKLLQMENDKGEFEGAGVYWWNHQANVQMCTWVKSIKGIYVLIFQSIMTPDELIIHPCWQEITSCIVYKRQLWTMLHMSCEESRMMAKSQSHFMECGSYAAFCRWTVFLHVFPGQLVDPWISMQVPSLATDVCLWVPVLGVVKSAVLIMWSGEKIAEICVQPTQLGPHEEWRVKLLAYFVDAQWIQAAAEVCHLCTSKYI